MPDGTRDHERLRTSESARDAYTAQPELKNGEVVCITQLPTSVGDPVTVKVSYQFHFLPLVGVAARALGGLTLSSTQTERAEVVPSTGVLRHRQPEQLHHQLLMTARTSTIGHPCATSAARRWSLLR